MYDTLPIAVRLGSLARAAAEGIRPELPRRVRLDLRVDESAETRAPGLALEIALLELLRNACEGMRRSGGVLTVAAGRPQRPFPHELTDGGEWVCVTVGDTGTGMDPVTLDELRDPDATRGGIARARRAIASAGGVLDINSWPGGGTVVRVYLPAA